MTTTTWKPVTEARYWEMLGCLPPALQIAQGFLVGEAYTHRECAHGGFRAAYSAFVELRDESGSHFYEAAQPLTSPEFRRITRADVLDNVKA